MSNTGPIKRSRRTKADDAVSSDSDCIREPISSDSECDDYIYCKKCAKVVKAEAVHCKIHNKCHLPIFGQCGFCLKLVRDDFSYCEHCRQCINANYWHCFKCNRCQPPNFVHSDSLKCCNADRNALCSHNTVWD